DQHRDHDDNRSAKSILKDEQKDIRSVRFKIVKHPETSIVPYVTSSSTDSVQSSKANPSGYKRTAQDCVEWVVTEIVQARCELIAVSEGVSSPGAASQQRMSRALETTPPGQGRGSHARSPSEEYNYQSPRSNRRSSVQVDLLIRDRVLQSLEVAEQLEKDALKESEEAEKKKKPKKSFSAFFSSSKSSSSPASRSEASGGAGGLLPPPSNNRSWLKKFQFGQDTDDETDDDNNDGHSRAHQRSRPASVNTSVSTVTTTSTTTTSAADGAGAESQAQDAQVGSTEGRKRSSSQQRNSGQGVFAKFKQAVKNL
ncbi:hypothetical protein BGZ95_008131, partial [Linnemannia exigua]